MKKNKGTFYEKKLFFNVLSGEQFGWFFGGSTQFSREVTAMKAKYRGCNSSIGRSNPYTGKF